MPSNRRTPKTHFDLEGRAGHEHGVPEPVQSVWSHRDKKTTLNWSPNHQIDLIQSFPIAGKTFRKITLMLGLLLTQKIIRSA